MLRWCSCLRRGCREWVGLGGGGTSVAAADVVFGDQPAVPVPGAVCGYRRRRSEFGHIAFAAPGDRRPSQPSSRRSPGAGCGELEARARRSRRSPRQRRGVIVPDPSPVRRRRWALRDQLDPARPWRVGVAPGFGKPGRAGGRHRLPELDAVRRGRRRGAGADIRRPDSAERVAARCL
jgi:hypothetical protein